MHFVIRELTAVELNGVKYRASFSSFLLLVSEWAQRGLPVPQHFLARPRHHGIAWRCLGLGPTLHLASPWNLSGLIRLKAVTSPSCELRGRLAELTPFLPSKDYREIPVESCCYLLSSHPHPRYHWN